jgi:hypothetical protein
MLFAPIAPMDELDPSVNDRSCFLCYLLDPYSQYALLLLLLLLHVGFN